MLTRNVFAGETIRIFRRSRSNRPPSATRADSLFSGPGMGHGHHHALHEGDAVGEGDEGCERRSSDPAVSSSAAAEAALLAEEEQSSKTEELPAPDTPAGTREAYLK